LIWAGEHKTRSTRRLTTHQIDPLPEIIQSVKLPERFGVNFCDEVVLRLHRVPAEGSLAVSYCTTLQHYATKSSWKERAMKHEAEESGKVGWAILWLLGVPLPILLVLFIMRGCT
jgi:hypothetical protein